jgi:DNA-directed RNA polymerase beta subunit
MSSQRKAVKSYRRRLKRQGIVRVEVQVRKDDAPLVRKVAQALSDPKREWEARAILNEKFREDRPKSFKELLASAPLEGIDLTREDDFGRDVDL